MNTYAFAVYFWSSLVALLVVTPFVVALARKAAFMLEEWHRHDSGEDSFPSLPSVPRPSRP